MGAQTGTSGGQSPIVVAESDSEEMRASLPLKRRRREKSVTSGAGAVDGSRSPLTPATRGMSSGAGPEALQIRSVASLVAFLFSLIHNARVAADFARTLDLMQRDYEARGKKLKEMKSQATETQRLLQKAKTVITQKDEEVKDGKRMLASCQESLKKIEEEKQSWGSREAELLQKMEELKKRASELEMAAIENTTEVEKLTARNQALENAVIDKHEKGYGEALLHVKFFHPEEDLEKYDPYGEVKDGKFVMSSLGGSASAS